ncbi:MAG TPA: N-acetylmuramic acid 6-phosphate etherase [candidate division Zixibacteria bacterium]|nr:N-acetylmuramic acid 6-phosphate etherase [candidate division Zixibacteria bacterium]
MSKKVFNQLKKLVTEKKNPRSALIDRLPTIGVLRIINAEDRKVPLALAKKLPQIARAVELYHQTYKDGGRIFYVGAGTSGRLGVLDASELPPTFGADHRRIKGLIAGGYRTLIRSREGVEDDARAAVRDLQKEKLKKNDLVIGISASRRTPYVAAAIVFARKKRAQTVFISANPRPVIPIRADVNISVVVGPEVVAGSTRMKAGTAQKLVLNMISTAAMVKLGKTYGNVMVDLRGTSEKLVERTKKTLMDLTGLSYSKAERLLEAAGGHLKTALVMALKRGSASKAKTLLKQAEGKLFRILA